MRFYDSSDPDLAWPLYSQAVEDGAQVVVGPLQKAAVLQLARAGELPVPVLALNQVQTDSTLPDQLYMYALSPEDEARQAAERIWSDGLHSPVAITPRNSWGERMGNAFETRWTELGGSIAGRQEFETDTHDYSGTITALLQIDRSKARHQRLQRWLGMRLEFEPRRRADVDAVFIAADPRQAQGLKPQLQFHHAADLPVYASSHAWSGTLDDGQLADMRGLLLADIPWLFGQSANPAGARDALAETLPEVNGPFARLYAMGMDAYALIPHLRRLRGSPFESLDGNTGNLYMNDSRQILRQLLWASLDSPPAIIGFSPRLDLAGPSRETVAPPGDGSGAAGTTPAAPNPAAGRQPG
jgi:hypothetical protein